MLGVAGDETNDSSSPPVSMLAVLIEPETARGYRLPPIARPLTARRY